MDEAAYNRTLAENEGLLRTIARASGFEGADEDELVQEIKLNFWKTRNKKRASESDKAYLIGVARKTVAMAVRRDKRMMRDAPCFGLEERDTAEFSSGTINGKEIFKSADQERVADQKRLAEDLVALAGMMRPSHESVVLNRLKADTEDVRSPAAATRVGMLRESRALLHLPEDNPGRAEITNPAAHLARVVRDAGRRRPSPQPETVRVNRPFRKQETPCALANSPTIIRKTDDATTQVQAPAFDPSTETSTPSFAMKIGQRETNTAGSRSFGRRPSSASNPPRSACVTSTPSTSARAPSRRRDGDRNEANPTSRRRVSTTTAETTRSSKSAPQPTSASRRGQTRSAR